MFERFTGQARRAVTLARDEARALRCDAAGPGHLLLSLVHEPGGEGARALARLGLDCKTVRRAVTTLLHAPPGATPGG